MKEGRYSSRNLACGASTRALWGIVLKRLTILVRSGLFVETPATSGFAVRAGDAMLDSVVSHSRRLLTRLRPHSHAFFVDSQDGPRHSATVRVELGPWDWNREKLLFVTETACQLNVTSPLGTPYARFSKSRRSRSANGQLYAAKDFQALIADLY